MRALLQDLRYAVRALRQAPVFTGVAVLTLTLGIGANTAIFSVVNGVLLRPLGYPESEELVSLYTRYLPSTGYDFPYFSLSGPEYLDVRDQIAAFEDVAAYVFDSANLASRSGDAERVVGVAATANLFRVLGRSPALGRGFAPGEDAPGAPCVSVLSDGLWRERFGGDPAVVGRDLRLGGAPCRIVGIMPADFRFPDGEPRLWRNLVLDPRCPASSWGSCWPWGRASHPYGAIARLAPGVTPSRAEAELAGLRARWSAEFPEHYARGHFAVLRPFREDLVGDVRPALLVLLGGVGAVLLVICANLAGLLVLRAESRRREIAVRVALGAGRLGIARLLLVESLLLALVGGTLGALLAGELAQGLAVLYPGPLPCAEDVGVDGAVLAFTAGISLLTGLAFGLMPAFQASSPRLQEILRTEGRAATAGRAGARVRRALVVAQIALGIVLVSGAALLARSYLELRREDVGIDPAGVLTFDLEASPGSYPEPADVRRFFAAVRERLASLPGVKSVGAISGLPLLSEGPADNFQIEGRAAPSPGEPGWNARYLIVSTGALETLGVALASGRLIDARDETGGSLVALVNETAGRTFWGGEDPVGRRIRYGDEGPWITIVGVVGDVRSLGVETPPPPAIYVPHAQTPRPSYPGRFMSVVVRAERDPRALVPSVRAAVREQDPDLPLASLQTMSEVVDAATGRPRFTMLVMLFFAIMALLLGALGVYGVLAQAVLQRSREIGLRMALGAERLHVLRLILGQGLAMATLGVALGTVAALSTARLLSTLLYGVSATDPVTFGAVALTLVTTALVASWLPARRALRLDPATSLRGD